MDKDSSSNNKRIAKNTLLLYARMLLLMVVSLYTSRVTLEALGIRDYGIYNVIGGMVAMFSILSGSLSAAIQRFLTFELGQENKEKLKTIFSTSVTIQIVLSFIIMVLAEVIGVWFLNHKMNIEPQRLYAANWVLQCSILTFMVNLISVPYNAAIIAHEKMGAFAYISILEALLKLLVVFLLYTVLIDRLIIYAVLLLMVSIIIRLIYGGYCKHKFEECSYHFTYDKQTFKNMSSFAGWNFIGSTAGILRTQGDNILLNLFFGTVVNAAQGIATQVSNVVKNFATNFMTALNPQITKSYASGNIEYLNFLLYQGARLSYYMLLFLSLPIILEAESLLNLWLVDVPEYSVIFVRLIVITSLIDAISNPLITAVLATGNIRNYQILAGGMNMLNFPLTYLFFKLGFAPEVTFVIGIIISSLLFFVRVIILKTLIGINPIDFIGKLLTNLTIVSIVSSIIPIIVHLKLRHSFISLVISVLICIICCSFSIYFLGCNRSEREFICKKISVIKSKILHKG